MNQHDYHLMNQYENELLDLIVKKKAYPHTITKKDENRITKLMRHLGMHTNILGGDE